MLSQQRIGSLWLWEELMRIGNTHRRPDGDSFARTNIHRCGWACGMSLPGSAVHELVTVGISQPHIGEIRPHSGAETKTDLSNLVGLRSDTRASAVGTVGK